jgi:hypothetical protein
LRGGIGPLGRREADDDRWVWFGEEAPDKERGTRRFAVIGGVAAGIAVVVAGALFFVLRTGDAGGPDPGPLAGDPSPSDMATLAPSPAGPATALRLSVWDSANRVWETDDLAVARAGGESQIVPFLLNIEQAVVGQTYNVTLTYECRSGQTPGLEYLTYFDGASGELAAQSPPGPQRPFPDTTVVLPDDPSTPGDDQIDLLPVWGGAPESLPTGPLPADGCVDEKSVVMRLRALSDTVHIMWGAQLGPETVASGQGEEVSLAMRVAIDGAAHSPAEINILVRG